MIDLTLSSSEDEAPWKLRRGPEEIQGLRAVPAQRPGAVGTDELRQPSDGHAAIAAAVGTSGGPASSLGARNDSAGANPNAGSPPKYEFFFGGDEGGEGEGGGVHASCRGAGDEIEGGAGGSGEGAQRGGLRRGRSAEDDDPDYNNSSPEAAPAPKRRGGGKRVTAEEKEERERAKADEKAAKAAEKARKQAEKLAEKERKAQEKEDKKRGKEAVKEAAKAEKEAGNSLKSTMVARHMRLLLSSSLQMSPLGSRIAELAPLARGGRKDETFPVEVHRLPLASLQYRYCMWGIRVPQAAANRLDEAAAAEGCALEKSDLPDVGSTGLALCVFPLLLLVLTGEELVGRLEAERARGGGGGPLASLAADVARAHPSATAIVYVTGLDAALRKRERDNKAFSRAVIEDLLFDVTVGMPAIRLQTDCPDNDLTRAATDIINYGWTLSQQPRKQKEAYLQNFGGRSTAPLRAARDKVREAGSEAALAACDALSTLVAPQRAAAVALRYPSLAALIEALRSKPEGPERDGLLARCAIPGVTPGRFKQLWAGPAAAASLARFLLTCRAGDAFIQEQG